VQVREVSLIGLERYDNAEMMGLRGQDIPGDLAFYLRIMSVITNPAEGSDQQGFGKD